MIIRKRPPRQRGQAIVLIAIMLAVVVGMAALAIDGSRAYALRRDLQAAVDAAALSAGDNLQQTGSFTGAEQAATTIFGSNLRLYSAPSCSPGYGTPGASPVTVVCTYSDGTVLTQVVASLGPQGARFSLTATRSLRLEFARILTNGASPSLGGSSAGQVNNLLFSPAVGVLAQSGCGGAGGTALTVSGSGTLNVNGDVVSSGAISVSGAALRVAGDIYARCQSTVPGSVSNACYPSGASTPCTYPDVAGATRSGFRFVDPKYPAPVVAGGSQGAPASTVLLQPGTYAANPTFSSADCWFLAGGVYSWQGGYSDTADFVSNELKPPDEPVIGSVSTVSTHQFWNTNGVNCAGSFQVSAVGGANSIDAGNYGVVLTSVRNDVYNGTSYRRESAPSACRFVHVHAGEVLQVQVSNLPGAISYNVYVGTKGNGCVGPWGWAGNIPVAGTVSNSNTNPCPNFVGAGCSLGHETATLDNVSLPDTFLPSPGPLPGTFEAYPPDQETSPLLATLPNQNPPTGAAAAGDRANENNCMTGSATYSSCPSGVTPGAVAFNLPSGACFTNGAGGDTYVFSGYQYNWMSVYEPSNGTPCTNMLGAAGNSAYIGLFYTPAGTINVTSAFAFESPSTGGLIADTVNFTGTMPTINFGAAYAPVPPASRLTG